MALIRPISARHGQRSADETPTKSTSASGITRGASRGSVLHTMAPRLIARRKVVSSSSVSPSGLGSLTSTPSIVNV